MSDSSPNRRNSTPDPPLLRSTELMRTIDTGLLVVDVQEKLIELIADHVAIVWNIGRLIDGAATLRVATAATEQYPKGLGGTVAQIAAKLPSDLPAKVAFSCGACGEVFAEWTSRGVDRVLLCGIETHVCVQQTALDLLSAGFRVYVAADAVGARRSIDHQIALRRMEASGVTLTTTEAALFEWCEKAGTPEFKKISALVQQTPPTD